MGRESIPVEVDRRVRAAARHRCGYRLSPQHLVMARLEVEHVRPLAAGGTSDEPNLWLSGPLCHRAKGQRTTAADPVTGEVMLLFNPRAERWADHFEWSPDGLRILVRTPTGRVTVAALHLADDPDALLVRSYWVEAGWHPPAD